MKIQLNEVRRMQQLAGLINESQLNEETKSYIDLKQAIEDTLGGNIPDFYFDSNGNIVSINYDASDYYGISPNSFIAKVKKIIKSNDKLKFKYKELKPRDGYDYFTDDDLIKYPELDFEKNDKTPSPDEDLIFAIIK